MVLEAGHGGNIWHILSLASVSGSHVLEPYLYNPFLLPDFLPNANKFKLSWPCILLVMGLQDCQLLLANMCTHSELLGVTVILMIRVKSTVAAIWGPTMTAV